MNPHQEIALLKLVRAEGVPAVNAVTGTRALVLDGGKAEVPALMLVRLSRGDLKQWRVEKADELA